MTKLITGGFNKSDKQFESNLLSSKKMLTTASTMKNSKDTTSNLKKLCGFQRLYKYNKRPLWQLYPSSKDIKEQKELDECTFNPSIDEISNIISKKIFKASSSCYERLYDKSKDYILSRNSNLDKVIYILVLGDFQIKEIVRKSAYE